MKWFLFRQDADGSRVNVAEYESEEAAREAMASYQYHHPQYAPYFVEAQPAPPGPRFVAPPLPPSVVGSQGLTLPSQAQPLPDPAAPATRSRAGLYAVAAAVLIGAAVIALFTLARSDGGETAGDAAPPPTEVERVTPRQEPTAPAPATPAPAPEPEDLTSPSQDSSDDSAPTPTPEEVTLTQSDGTLAAIRARGELNCGVSGRIAPFSLLETDGSVTGFDADMCRAVATAILGDSQAVNFVPLTAAMRFTELQSGNVDLLMRNSTWTQSRDTDVGVDFGPTTFYDGQQLMGRAEDGFDISSDFTSIEGAVVCTIAGTTTELNIIAAAEDAGLAITVQTFEDFSIVTDQFIVGACDLITTDGSVLAARKMELQPSNEEWVIFPPVPISKEPLGPIYRQDDSRFADVVNWTVFAMLIADENGINQANVVASAVDPANAEVDRLLGGRGELQSLMGLEPDAFGEVIRQVGSYSDVFNRHLAPVGFTLEGSLNDLWVNGGLMYAPPAR